MYQQQTCPDIHTHTHLCLGKRLRCPRRGTVTDFMPQTKRLSNVWVVKIFTKYVKLFLSVTRNIFRIPLHACVSLLPTAPLQSGTVFTHSALFLRHLLRLPWKVNWSAAFILPGVVKKGCLINSCTTRSGYFILLKTLCYTLVSAFKILRLLMY